MADPEPLLRQLSLTSTFSNSQSATATSDVEQGPLCSTTAAAAAAAAGPGIELKSCLTAACQQNSSCDDSFHGVTDQLLEEQMSNGMGLPGPSAQHQQQLLASKSEQLLQQGASTGHVHMSSSCSNLAAASAQQLQQQAWPCSPCQVAGPASARVGPTWAAAAEHQHQLPPTASTQAQQTQQGQQVTDSELQQLLMMALEAAGHTAGQLQVLSTAQLHEQALQECCNEFLAAAASTVPALTASLPGTWPAQQHHQQQHSASRSGSPAAMPAQRGNFEVSSSPSSLPAGQDRQCAQSTTGLRAVLYVAAIMRAVLDLYTVLLHRCVGAQVVC
jgi:hypothetical protein